MLKRLIPQVKFLWITAGTVLVLLLLLEGMSVLAFYVRNKSHPRPVDYRIAADGYRDAKWVEEYFSEWLASRSTQWHTYIHHKRCAFGE